MKVMTWMRALSLIILFSLVTLASTSARGQSTVLVSIANDKYQEYTSCVRATKDPAVCLREYADYVRAAANVVNAGDQTNERERISRSADFLEEVASRYMSQAMADGSAEMADKTSRIYRVLSQVRSNRASEFERKIQQLNNITQSQDLSIRIANWLPGFNADLRAGVSPSDKNRAFVSEIVGAYPLLPAAQRTEIDTSLSLVVEWLARYLSVVRSEPLAVDPADFAARADFYRLASQVPTEVADVHSEISGTEIAIAAAVNAMAEQNIATLTNSEQTWIDSVGSAQLHWPPEVETLHDELLEAREEANNIIRILTASRAHLPSVSSEFIQDEGVIVDTQRWVAAERGLGLLVYLHQRNLEDALAEFTGLPLGIYELVPESQVQSAGQSSISQLFDNLVEAESRTSLFEAATFISQVDSYAHSTFLDSRISETWSEVIGDLLTDDTRFSGMSQVVSMYADLRQRHSRNEEVERLRERLIKTAFDSIGSSGIEEIYAYGGIQLVMQTLGELPSVMLRVDPGQAAEMEIVRYEGLLDSDIIEVELTNLLYQKFTTKADYRDARGYVRMLGDTVGYARRLGRASGDDSYHRFMMRLAEVEEEHLRDTLPIGEDELRSEYPETDTSICMLELFGNGDLSVLLANGVMDGFKRYHPFTFVLHDRAEERLGMQRVASAFASFGGSDLPEPPEPLISSEEIEEGAFVVSRKITETCFSDYPQVGFWGD